MKTIKMPSTQSHKHLNRSTNHRGGQGCGLRELSTGLLEGTRNKMSHGPSGETDLEYINYGEEDQMEIYGYRKCLWRTALTWSVIILTCGIVRLLFHWKPTWMLVTTHERCSLQIAEKVLIAEQYHKKHRRYYVKAVKTLRADEALNSGSSGFESEPCWNDHMLTDVSFIEKAHLAVHFGGGTFKSHRVIRLFRCKKQTYVWEDDSGDFHRLCGLDKRVLVSALHQQQGLTQQEQLSRLLAFGTNEIVIPVQSVVTLLFLEVLNPYYVFQVLSFILWFVDDYMYYALTILAMSAFGVIMSVIQARKTQHKLRSTIHASDVATVRRGSAQQTETVSTDQLVPGDVLVIPRHGYTMNCDAVLLTGNCIVNESMLTGESVPVTKTPLPNHPELIYDKKEHAKHTLFCGTQIIQARYFGHESVLAVVIRSGFSTSKGELVRAILYPPPVDFKFERDSYRFIGLMASVAMIGFVYTVVTKAMRGMSISALILEACDLVTVVVPPALPAAMTVGSFYAQKRLERKSIYCISPRNINIAGAIDCVCFDKTGTLTEDGLDMWGVVPVKNSAFLVPERAVSTMDNNDFLFGMATCHSLTIIDGELSGEPLDLKMFESTGWELEEHDVEDSSKFDMLFPTVVKPPKGRYKCIAYDSEIDDVTLGIVRQFPFSSNLQRMSVIMRRLGDSQYTVYCKGSPEMIASLCYNNTVPSDFDTVLQEYAQQGYRVLALAFKGLSKTSYVKTQRIAREDVESNLMFLGLIVMENRLKPETTGVIKQLKAANIRTVMITGDNLLTAVSVGRECGLVKPSQRIIVVNGKPPLLSTPPRLFYTNAASRFIQNETQTTELVPDVPNSSSFINACNVESSSVSGVQPLTSSHGAANSPETPSSSDLPDYLFALDGQSWSIVKDYFPDLVPKILTRGAVFARTSPEQKQQIVQGLQDMGYYVAMCGDGANDCGALKAAHAGISLSEAESSVASPFTSKEANISCIPNLIREGRAALVTSFGIFKYMAAYSLTQFVSVMILYSIDSNLTDIEYLYIDLFIITIFAFFFGRSEAYDGPLFKQPPILSLVSFSCVLSLITQAVTVTSFQSASFFIIQHAPWFEPFNSSVREAEDGSVECYENYALFAVSSFQYIILALIFSKGAPYRKFIFYNIGFSLTFIVLTGFTIYLVLSPFEWLRSSFELKVPPDMRYRCFMLILAFVNFVVSAFLEYFIVDHIFIHKLRYELPTKNKSSKLYLTSEEHLKHDCLWPPITNEIVCDPPEEDGNRRIRRPIVSRIYSVNEEKQHIGNILNANSSHNNEVTLCPATFLDQRKVNILSQNTADHMPAHGCISVGHSNSIVQYASTNEPTSVNNRNSECRDIDYKNEEMLTVSPKTLINGTTVCATEKMS